MQTEICAWLYRVVLQIGSLEWMPMSAPVELISLIERNKRAGKSLEIDRGQRYATVVCIVMNMASKFVM